MCDILHYCVALPIQSDQVLVVELCDIFYCIAGGSTSGSVTSELVCEVSSTQLSIGNMNTIFPFICLFIHLFINFVIDSCISSFIYNSFINVLNKFNIC